MQVLDIIHRAAVKSGVVPTFNPDEMPGEVEANGRQILEQDVLVGINCDRTLDVTSTAITAKPTKGELVIASLPIDHDMLILGETEYASTELTTGPVASNKCISILETYHLTYQGSYRPAKDEFGNKIDSAIWCSDGVLCMWGKSATSVIPLVTKYNFKYPPMDVISVFEDSNRHEYQFVYREEFESAEFYKRDDVYTVEVYEDSIKLLFHKTADTDKRIVLPVPVIITNTNGSGNDGVINAPAKFEYYIGMLTAVGLAQMYGMSTLQSCADLAGQGYNRLKKNRGQSHGQNIRKQVRNYIRGYNDFI